jgi:hypothetical protein
MAGEFFYCFSGYACQSLTARILPGESRQHDSTICIVTTAQAHEDSQVVANAVANECTVMDLER